MHVGVYNEVWCSKTCRLVCRPAVFYEHVYSQEQKQEMMLGQAETAKRAHCKHQMLGQEGIAHLKHSLWQGAGLHWPCIRDSSNTCQPEHDPQLRHIKLKLKPGCREACMSQLQWIPICWATPVHAFRQQGHHTSPYGKLPSSPGCLAC